MHIVVVGVDYTTTPIALRERLACSLLQVHQVLRATQQVVQECILLSTCNRVELYAVCQEVDEGQNNLLHVISSERDVSLAELQECSYTYVDEQAVTHLFGVACGVYSLVPGEPQIQGQVAEALEVAQKEGSAGPITSGLFRAALVTGKRARSETAISRNSASVSHVAVQLARQFFPDLHQACVLLIGSGKMSELAAHNLCDSGAKQLIILNRTQEHAIELAQRFGAVHKSLADLTSTLLVADVVITSTTAPKAIITYELIQEVMALRAGKPLLIIDIALPRNVDADVQGLPGVHLYNLDDLQTSVSKGIQLRIQEVEHVQAIILQEATVFDRWLHSLSVSGTIRDLRQHADELRQQELMRTLKQMSASFTDREVAAVQELSTRLLNKLLHTPTLRLKEAAADGQGQIYTEALRYLFDLEEKTNEVHYNRDSSQQARDDTNELDRQATPKALARSGNSYRTNTHNG